MKMIAVQTIIYDVYLPRAGNCNIGTSHECETVELKQYSTEHVWNSFIAWCNYYYYYLESAVQDREKVRTLSVQRPQPHTTNPWKEEDKIVGYKKKEHIMPTGKHWLCF